MKKILSIVLVLAMAFSMCMVTGCGKDDSSETSSDLQYVKDNGKLVVGITEFAPIQAPLLIVIGLQMMTCKSSKS